MKQKLLAALLLVTLILIGCSTPGDGVASEPVIDLSAYEAELDNVTLSFCGYAEKHNVDLATYDYVIPLNEYKPSCALESAPENLDDFLDIPGLQYDLNNVRTTGVIIEGNRGWLDYFDAVASGSKEASLMYVEGSGYLRFNGTIEEAGMTAALNINVTFSPGWQAVTIEVTEEPPALRIQQVPVNSLVWKSNF